MHVKGRVLGWASWDAFYCAPLTQTYACIHQCAVLYCHALCAAICHANRGMRSMQVCAFHTTRSHSQEIPQARPVPCLAVPFHTVQVKSGLSHQPSTATSHTHSPSARGQEVEGRDGGAMSPLATLPSTCEVSMGEGRGISAISPLLFCPAHTNQGRGNEGGWRL